MALMVGKCLSKKKMPKIDTLDALDDEITSTRSYAALRAADLDWIVGPGYSPGR